MREPSEERERGPVRASAMSRLATAVSLIVLPLGLAGCATGATPEAAAETWLQAQEDGDVEKLAELTLGADWVLDSPLPEARVSGITDTEVLSVEEDEYGPEVEVGVRWTVEGGEKVETTLTLEDIGGSYAVIAPEDAIPDIRPAALTVDSWVDPASEHLDPAFVPECGEAGLDHWCAEFSGADAERYAMLPFGAYEYTARSNAIGVAGSPEVRVVIGDYNDQEVAMDGDVFDLDDPQVALTGDLFDMKPEAVEDIDAALAALAAECPVVGPDEEGRCAHPGAAGETRLDPASWKAFNGGVTLQLHVGGAAGSESTVLDYSYDGDGGLEPWNVATDE